MSDEVSTDGEPILEAICIILVGSIFIAGLDSQMCVFVWLSFQIK